MMRRSTTEAKLVEALRRMREHGRKNDEVTSMTHLFGIIFYVELDALGRGGRGRIAQMLNEQDPDEKVNGGTIKDGMNLVPYVEPNLSVWHRWRQ